MNKSMSVYMAGPIDDITDAEAGDWREEAARLAPAGVLLFNPLRAWHGVSPVTAAAVAYGDRVAIAHCDGVLANLAGPGRAFGTIREIEFARSHGKPVAVAFGEREITSCFAHDIFQSPTLDGALGLLVDAIREQQDRPRGFFLGVPMVADDDDE